MNFKNLLFASVIVLSANASFAQDTNKASHTVKINIKEIALLDLESSTGTAIILEGTLPKEAGLPMTFDAATDASTWINYSSIVGKKTEAARNISVQITDGDVPAGLKLTVLAAGDAGKGAGTMGTANADAISLKLGDAAFDIIKGVGSAYTGDKSGSGHKLTYQLGYAGTTIDYAGLDADNSSTVTITYTLSDI